MSNGVQQRLTEAIDHCGLDAFDSHVLREAAGVLGLLEGSGIWGLWGEILTNAEQEN